MFDTYNTNFNKSNLPNGLNIYVLYWMNLITTVFSYWLLAYKMALFQAHQKGDVVSKISIITYSIRYFLQLFIIIVVKLLSIFNCNVSDTDFN